MIKRLVRSLFAPAVQRLLPRRIEPPLSRWRLSRSADGVLSLDGHRLDALLARWGSPLHLVDGAALRRAAVDFLAIPSGATRGCDIAYSFKTNPVPGVLRRLLAAGIGAEVVSPYELWLALRLGFPPRQIVYNGPARSEASMRSAIEHRIGLVNLNSRCEIAPFAALARELGQRPRVGIRVALPGSWSGQFGERTDSGAAFRAFAEAAQRPELSLVALHAHRGSEFTTHEELEQFIAQVLVFTDELRARLSLELEVLDLGGSLACCSVRQLGGLEKRLNRAFDTELQPQATDELSVRAAVALAVSQIEAHYHRVNRPVPRILLEPGKSMTGHAQMLLTRVVNVQDEVEGVTHAVLDASVFVAAPVRAEYHHLLPVRTQRGAALRSYRLVGPSCTPADVLYPSWRLPELAPGDVLAMMDSGAYFIPFSSAFSFPRPGVVMLENGEETLLRAADSYEQMAGLEGAPPR